MKSIGSWQPSGASKQKWVSAVEVKPLQPSCVLCLHSKSEFPREKRLAQHGFHVDPLVTIKQGCLMDRLFRSVCSREWVVIQMGIMVGLPKKGRQDNAQGNRDLV